jgi:hypothetical protein
MNIDGALREWFMHGRIVYEMRRLQMQEVAAMAGITHMCTLLDEPFESRLREWHEKYTPLQFSDSIPEEEEPPVYEEDSGFECTEYTEIAIDRMAEIQHICKDGVEYLWFTPLPGPHVPVDYLKLILILLPILWYMVVYGALFAFGIFTILEMRSFVRIYLKYLVAIRRMDNEILGLQYEFLREHPHIAAAA